LTTIAAWRQAMAEPAAHGMMAFDGHGMTEHCTEGLSVAHVSAHERGHLNSYRMRALAEGYEVVSEDIDIRFEMRDGRLVAVAGEAKARHKPRESHQGTDTAAAHGGATAPATQAASGEASAAEAEGESRDGGTVPSASAEHELKRERQEAAGQVRSAEAALSSLPATPRTEDERRRIADAQTDKVEGEERLRSADLALQAEQLARMIAQQSAVISGAVEAQTQLAARIAYTARA